MYSSVSAPNPPNFGFILPLRPCDRPAGSNVVRNGPTGDPEHHARLLQLVSGCLVRGDKADAVVRPVATGDDMLGGRWIPDRGRINSEDSRASWSNQPVFNTHEGVAQEVRTIWSCISLRKRVVSSQCCRKEDLSEYRDVQMGRQSTALGTARSPACVMLVLGPGRACCRSRSEPTPEDSEPGYRSHASG